MITIPLPSPFHLELCQCRTFNVQKELLIASTEDSYCLGLMVKGRMNLSSQSSTFTLNPGDLWGISAPKDAVLTLTPDESSQGVYLILKGPDCPDLIRRWGINPETITAQARYPHRIHLLLEQLHNHFQRPKGHNPFFILTRLLRIAEYQYRIENLSSEEHHREIINLITESWKLDPSLNIADIAKRLRLSATTLRNYCHQVLSVSPHNYLNRLRQDMAKELLFKTDYKITHISGEIGFPNDKYFVTWFKRLEGLTPTEWRLRFSKPSAK